MERLGFLLILLMTLPSWGAEIFRIEIRGSINPATSRYLGRSIHETEKAGGQLLLVELDTPGGLVSSVREMAQSIESSKIPVVVFTTPAGASATSAGAILMISSHLAAMSLGTNIGAAHPVGAQGEDISGAMGEKAVQDISAFARSMAELRKRNIEASGEVVSKSKSYTAEEALKAHLIEIISPNVVSLLADIDGRALQFGQRTVVLRTKPAPSLHNLEMTFGEKVLNTIAHPNIAAVLMTLAILLIYAELSAPGIGIAGILGGVCLITAFIAFQALSIRVGGLVLLGLGILLILSEVFVGMSGALAFGGSLALLLGLLWGADPAMGDLRISPWVLGALAIVLFSGTFLIGYGVSRIRKRSAETLASIGGGGGLGVQGYKGVVFDVEPDGRSGQILIRGELWKFISTEPMKEKDPVVVRGSRGLRLEVAHETG